MACAQGRLFPRVLGSAFGTCHGLKSPVDSPLLPFRRAQVPGCAPQVIAAEGEMNASRALKEASMVITESPAALQLRYLQTLTTIAAEKNSTIVFPLPINILQGLLGVKE